MMKKRILALVLTLAMLLSIVPGQVFAAETSTVHTEHNFVEVQPESTAPAEEVTETPTEEVTKAPTEVQKEQEPLTPELPTGGSSALNGAPGLSGTVGGIEPYAEGSHTHTISVDCHPGTSAEDPDIAFTIPMNQEHLNELGGNWPLNDNGEYFLETDLEFHAYGSFEIDCDADFCLNGYDVTFPGMGSGFWQVEARGSDNQTMRLRICDCAPLRGEEPSVITGSDWFGPIGDVSMGDTVEVYGGHWISKVNAVITVEDGELGIYGGTYETVNADSYGFKNVENGKLVLSGSPVINSTKADIYLATDKVITLVDALEPTDGELYTVDVDVPLGGMVRITEGFGASGNTENPFRYFDNLNNEEGKPQCFILGEGADAEVYIGYRHEHCSVYTRNCPDIAAGGECSHEKVVYDRPLTQEILDATVNATGNAGGGQWSLGGGNYFLTEDVHSNYDFFHLRDEDVDINLCLCGYNITKADNKYSRLYPGNNTKVRIDNCKPEGAVTSAYFYPPDSRSDFELVLNANLNTGYVSNVSGSFTMLGGTWTTTSTGNALQVKSGRTAKYYIRGGTMTGAKKYEIYLSGDACNPLETLVLSGSPTINVREGGIADIRLGEGNLITLDGILDAPGNEVYTIDVVVPLGGMVRITEGFGTSGNTENPFRYYQNPDNNEDEGQPYSFILGEGDEAEVYIGYKPHIHCKYGENCEYKKNNEECQHEQITFNIPMGDSFKTESGSYYLTEELSIGYLNLPENREIHLCLNGINLTAGEIDVNPKGDEDIIKLYIYDCDGKGSDNAFSLDRFYMSGNTEVHLISGHVVGAENCDSPVSTDSAFFLEGGTFTVCPEGGSAALYPSITSYEFDKERGRVILASGEIINIGAGSSVAHLGVGELIMDGTVKMSRLDGNETIADIALENPFGAGHAEITIGQNFAPEGEVYSVYVSAAFEDDGTYRITTGWGALGEKMPDYIPFKSTQGYEVVELDYTRPDGTVTKELYLVKHQHCVYGANCEDIKAGNACSHGIIWFDQALDQDMMESFHRDSQGTNNYVHIPSGNYFLTSDIDMDFINEGLRFNEGAEVYLCLNGHSITNLGEISVTGNAKVYICDCKNDPETGENQGRIDIAHNVWVGLDKVYTETGFLSFHGGTINVLEGSYNPLNVWHCGEFILDGGTFVVNGNGGTTEAIYGYWYGASYPKLTLKSGTIKHTGDNWTIAQFGDTYLTLSGTVKIENDNAPADFYLYPEIEREMTVLTITDTFDPQGEIYSVYLDPRLEKYGDKFRITDGWASAELDIIPFISVQGYMVVEMEYNGNPELYLVKPKADAYLWNGHDVAATGTQLFDAMYSYDPNYLTTIKDWTFAVSNVELKTQTLPVAVDGDRITFDAGVGGGYGGDAWITIQQVDEESGAVLKTERLLVNLNIHVYDVKDSVYILDYADPVKLNETIFAHDTMPGMGKDVAVKYEAYSNTEPVLEDDGLSMTFEVMEDLTGKYGQFAISEDGTEIIYTPNAMIEGKDEIYTIFRAYKNGVETSDMGTSDPFKEVEMYKSIFVLPANVVYYEDDNAALNWNPDETDETDGIKIEILTGDSTGDGYQDGDNDSEYGNDSDYAYAPGEYTGSGGTRKEITINGNGTILTFTFTGTGFDVLGTTNAESGTMEIVITDSKDPNNPVYIPLDTYYANGEIVEAPLIHKELPYGTYTVAINAVPEYDWDATDGWTDHPDPKLAALGIQVPPMKEYKLWFDGVRIYNPLDMDDENRQNYNDIEREAKFVQVRNLILEGKAASVSFDANGSFTFGTGNVFYVEDMDQDNTYNGKTTDINDYLVKGPNNELYFNSATQSLVLYARATLETEPMLQIGVRNLNPTALGQNGSTVGDPGVNLISEWGPLPIVDAETEGAIGYTEQYYTVDLYKCYQEWSDDNEDLYLRVVLSAANADAFSISNLKYSGLEFLNIPVEENVLVYDENGQLSEEVAGDVDESMPNLWSLERQLRKAYNMLPEDTFEPMDESMQFTGITLSLNDSIGMNIYVNETVFDGYEDPYILIEKFYSDGVVYETSKVYPTKTVPYGTATCINFLYEDMAAMEMSATVRMTLYATKDGVLTRGEVRNYSILTYAMNTLGKTMDPALKTLLVDMLNYGAQAQIYFNYHEEFLANSTLTEEQKAWATTEEPILVNGFIKDNPGIPGSGSYPFAITSASLQLKDKVELNFFMDPGTGDFAGKKMILTYVNEAGEEIRTEISAENFVLDPIGLYKVTFDGLSAKDMRVLVTCWIADENGERMSNAITYGIECYAASKVSNETLKPLLLDMMRYGDSAWNYFTARNQG